MTQRKKTAQKVRNVPAFTLLVSALSAVPAFAQTGASPAAAGDRTTITVTGSRASNRSAAETAVPVDIINQEMIEATGAVEVGRLLQKLAPSFNFPQSFVSDGTDLIWPASLRGMGPDQVLVLVNGKRRHQQALVNVQQSIGRGSAGTDINTIPISAIDRIEILRDGASAQYGSDAIAGVINIILKSQREGGSVMAEYGKTYEGDGRTYKVAGNGGFKLGGGFLNITGEYVERGETNRAGLDSLRVSPPRVTQRIGDAETKSGLLWVNGAVPFGRTELYFFGGASSREGNSSGFFRPSSDGRTIPALYPAGFLPTLLTTTDDYSLAVGLRGDINRSWTYDLSINRGFNQFEFASSNSANVSWYYEPRPGGGIFGETPTSANDGTLRFKQWTANFDVKGTADWGIGREPIALAAGLEWRQDGYQIVAGDPVSYTYGRTNNPTIFIPNQSGTAAAAGIQGFPGFSPTTEVDGKRNSVGIYGDAEAALTSQLLLGAALRFEDYSDAGTNTTGKVSMRFQATPQFALRGSLSNGFRAPSVQQQFFSQISTTLGAQGVLTDTVTARQGSELTRLFGIQPLKQETSRTGAVGFVFQGRNGFHLTADVYRIDVKDRIVFSSEIGPDGLAGCTNPAICPVRVILGSLNLGAATFFTNAADTETTGADIVGQYTLRLDRGAKLQLDATYSYNKTKITHIRSQSSVIPIDVLFDQTQRTLLQEGLPHHRGSVGGIYSTGPWRFGINNTYYGEVSGQGFTGVKQTWSGKWLTDVTLNYRLNRNLDVTVGGNNVFDVYPDKWTDEAGFPLNALGFTYGWETLPFGLNGASYYVRARFTF